MLIPDLDEEEEEVLLATVAGRKIVLMHHSSLSFFSLTLSYPPPLSLLLCSGPKEHKEEGAEHGRLGPGDQIRVTHSRFRGHRPIHISRGSLSTERCTLGVSS